MAGTPPWISLYWYRLLWIWTYWQPLFREKEPVYLKQIGKSFNQSSINCSEFQLQQFEKTNFFDIHFIIQLLYNNKYMCLEKLKNAGRRSSSCLLNKDTFVKQVCCILSCMSGTPLTFLMAYMGFLTKNVRHRVILDTSSDYCIAFIQQTKRG